MSYAFWSLVGQGVQIGIASDQLRVARAQSSQLLAINNQLAYQQAVQQEQALLNQVLFETEQAASSMSAMAAHDPFSAGVLSCLRLRYVHGIESSFFHALDAKRSWAHATGQLMARWQWVEAHPAMSDVGRRFVHALEQLMQWRKVLGPDPDGEIRRRDATIANTSNKIQRCLISAVVGPILLIVGIAASMPLVTFAGVVVPFVTGLHAFNLHRARTRMRMEANDYRSKVDQFNWFMASPDGGGLLNSVAARHPQLAGAA